MGKLSENIELCERVAAGDGVALPVMSLPHQDMAKQTAKAVGGTLQPLPMFGKKVVFGSAFIATSQAQRKSTT